MFDHTGYGRAVPTSTMSARAYVILLSLFTALGLAISGFTASLTYAMQMNGWLVVGLIILTFFGTFLATRDDIVTNTIGYVIMAIGLGAITGPYVAQYTTASVVQVFFLTMAVTIGIGVAGALAPVSVSHWGGFLLTGLLVLIVVQFGTIFLAATGFNTQVAMTALDWVAVFLFSGYVFYDMNQAMRSDYSVQNAMRFAVSMYLNVMNLFIRLLSLFGSNDD